MGGRPGRGSDRIKCDQKFTIALTDEDLEILNKHADKASGLVAWNSETIGVIQKILKIEVQDLLTPFDSSAFDARRPHHDTFVQDLRTKQLLYSTPNIIFNDNNNSITLVVNSETATTNAHVRLRTHHNFVALQLLIFNPTYTLQILNFHRSIPNNLTQDELDAFKDASPGPDQETEAFIKFAQNTPTKAEEFWGLKPVVTTSIYAYDCF